jgi:CheY-like chemotaxis protein
MVSIRPRRERLYILTVEDDPDTSQNLACLLRREGHEVNIASDGPAALRSAQVQQPDVVLLDLGLPGMSGYDVARHLSHHQGAKRPLLIAVTGQAGAQDRHQAAEAGIDLQLVKPVDPSQLNEVLRRFERIILPLPPDND